MIESNQSFETSCIVVLVRIDCSDQLSRDQSLTYSSSLRVNVIASAFIFQLLV